MQNFDSILLAIRPNSPDILKLIKATDKISRGFNTNFNMLHVVNSNITDDEINILKSTADQNLIGTCGKLIVIKSDDPIYTVSELTSEYDLLVLGTPRKDSLKSIFFGTGKDKFAVNATCSVLRLTVKNSLTNQ